jgi:transcriptional regulator of acetoin/glycerol metabolism
MGDTPSWEDLERGFLHDALNRNRWNRTATAKQLGVHKSTLWRKMNRLGLRVPGSKPANGST